MNLIKLKSCRSVFASDFEIICSIFCLDHDKNYVVPSKYKSLHKVWPVIEQINIVHVHCTV